MDKVRLAAHLEATLASVEVQTRVIMDEAERRDTNPFLMRNPDGDFALVPLLSARAHILSAMAFLKTN